MTTKRFVAICMVMAVIAISIVGCKGKENISIPVEEKWSEITSGTTGMNTSSSELVCKVYVKISMYQDLTEEEIISILKYYWDEKFNGGKNVMGGYEAEAIYGIFYQGDTDDVINKVKFDGDEIVEITPEDEETIESLILTGRDED